LADRKEINMTKKHIHGAAALVGLALLGWPSVAAGDDVEREAQDRAQIEKLMWQYVRALDTENAEAYAAVFTPDGQFGTGTNAVKGREALKKMINDFRQRTADNEAKTGEKRPAMYHVITNNYLEFADKDHARLQAYWMTVFAAGGEKTPARVAAAGREVDELVRSNGQWLIKARDVAPKE
jgi:uncharacterized protein (TIGR02246 family)